MSNGPPVAAVEGMAYYEKKRDPLVEFAFKLLRVAAAAIPTHL